MIRGTAVTAKRALSFGAGVPMAGQLRAQPSTVREERPRARWLSALEVRTPRRSTTARIRPPREPPPRTIDEVARELMLRNALAVAGGGAPGPARHSAQNAGPGQSRHKTSASPVSHRARGKRQRLISARRCGRSRTRLPRHPNGAHGGREANFYELLELAQKTPDSIEFLLRAERPRNRRAEQWPPKGEYLAAQPAAGIQESRLPQHGPLPARTTGSAVRSAKPLIRA